MTGKTVPTVSTEVKALRIVLITLLVLYGVVSVYSVYSLARVVPSLVNLPSGTPFLGILSVTCHRVLPGFIYAFIAFNIFKLIGLISHGEPFSPASPRYIRGIGYAVFCLAAARAVVDAINALTPPVNFLSGAVIWDLGSGLSTLLLGFGFLVIARVIEAGVRLQQDQNLTV